LQRRARALGGQPDAERYFLRPYLQVSVALPIATRHPWAHPGGPVRTSNADDLLYTDMGWPRAQKWVKLTSDPTADRPEVH